MRRLAGRFRSRTSRGCSATHFTASASPRWWSTGSTARSRALAAELCFEVYKPAPKADEDEELPLFKLLSQQSEVPSAPIYQQIARPQRPDLPESELNPKLNFDRFVSNSANRMTFEAALAVAEHPATLYNPFFIYGGVGLGKTHLLQSIAHICQGRGQRVIYIPSEVFTKAYLENLSK